MIIRQDDLLRSVLVRLYIFEFGTSEPVREKIDGEVHFNLLKALTMVACLGLQKSNSEWNDT
jgi:hypothetical protein